MEQKILIHKLLHFPPSQNQQVGVCLAVISLCLLCLLGGPTRWFSAVWENEGCALPKSTSFVGISGFTWQRAVFLRRFCTAGTPLLSLAALPRASCLPAGLASQLDWLAAAPGAWAAEQLNGSRSWMFPIQPSRLVRKIISKDIIIFCIIYLWGVPTLSVHGAI